MRLELWLTVYSQVCDRPLEHGHFIRRQIFKENWLSAVINYQYLCSEGVNLVTTFHLYAGYVWLELSSYVNCPIIVPNHSFVIVLCDLWLLESFCFLLHTGPWTSGREGCDLNAPFMTEHLPSVTPCTLTISWSLLIAVSTVKVGFFVVQSKFKRCTKLGSCAILLC